MEGIYTTSVNQSTIDESPMAYKPMNEIIDRINIYYSENKEFEDAILNYIDLIKDETLALELIKKDLDVEVSNLNGIDVKFDVEKQ